MARVLWWENRYLKTEPQYVALFKKKNFLYALFVYYLLESFNEVRRREQESREIGRISGARREVILFRNSVTTQHVVYTAPSSILTMNRLSFRRRSFRMHSQQLVHECAIFPLERDLKRRTTTVIRHLEAYAGKREQLRNSGQKA